jgi:hypothetical protein
MAMEFISWPFFSHLAAASELSLIPSAVYVFPYFIFALPG